MDYPYAAIFPDKNSCGLTCQRGLLLAFLKEKVVTAEPE